MSTTARPSLPFTAVYAIVLRSDSVSSNLRPMKRLIEVIVLFGVGDRLVLGGLADDALAVLAERDDRRRRAVALGVDDDRRLAALEDRDRRVRRAQVDAQHLRHVVFSFRCPAEHARRRGVLSADVPRSRLLALLTCASNSRI